MPALLLMGSGSADYLKASTPVVAVTTLAFTQRVASAETLWDGVVDGTVRTAALVRGQDEATRRRIRAAFDRIVARHDAGGELDIPVSVKLASERR